jgi:hypothetical protein
LAQQDGIKNRRKNNAPTTTTTTGLETAQAPAGQTTLVAPARLPARLLAGLPVLLARTNKLISPRRIDNHSVGAARAGTAEKVE